MSGGPGRKRRVLLLGAAGSGKTARAHAARLVADPARARGAGPPRPPDLRPGRARAPAPPPARGRPGGLLRIARRHVLEPGGARRRPPAAPHAVRGREGPAAARGAAGRASRVPGSGALPGLPGARARGPEGDQGERCRRSGRRGGPPRDLRVARRRRPGSASRPRRRPLDLPGAARRGRARGSRGPPRAPPGTGCGRTPASSPTSTPSPSTASPTSRAWSARSSGSSPRAPAAPGSP
jgi:hypothetical protein